MIGTRWITKLVALLVILGLVEPMRAQEPQTVTLDQAIQRALMVNPQMVRARGQVANAAAGKRTAIGNWLPSLSTSSSYSTRGVDPVTTPDGLTFTPSGTSYSAGLNASMTLFSGFRRLAQNRSAGADYRSAEASEVAQEFNVILQTKQAFFNAVAANELVRVAERSIQRAEEQLRMSKDKLAAGSAIRSDTLRGRVEVGNAQLQLLNAETQRETAEANLAQLIGVDGPVRAIVDSSLFTPIDVDTTALRIEAVAQSPTVIQADAAADAAAASVSVATAQYFPNVTASYSRSWSGTQISALDNNWSARVGLSWTLFNGFSREGNVTSAKVNRESAEADAEDARRQVNAEFTTYIASLNSARLSLDIAIANQLASEEELRVQQERYRLGMSTVVDVLVSQISLEQAEVDIVRARLDYLVAKAQIESLIGREL
jgi:outer membrane protein TolC